MVMESKPSHDHREGFLFPDAIFPLAFSMQVILEKAANPFFFPGRPETGPFSDMNHLGDSSNRNFTALKWQ